MPRGRSGFFQETFAVSHWVHLIVVQKLPVKIGDIIVTAFVTYGRDGEIVFYQQPGSLV